MESNRGAQRDIKEHSLITNEMAINIIDTRRPRGAFYTVESNGTYVGIDNTDGEAWTEDFETLEECEKWLDGKSAESKAKRTLDANNILEDVKRILKNWGEKYDASRMEIIHTAQAALTFVEIDEEE